MVVARVKILSKNLMGSVSPSVLKSSSLQNIMEYMEKVSNGREYELKVFHGEEAEKFEKYAFQV